MRPMNQPLTDRDRGIFRGKSIARRFLSPDGFIVLVGRSARDNDVLSIKLASPKDFWMHVAAQSGSHVVIRNPDGVDRLPRETERFAAGLAAGYSGARAGGQVDIHMARGADVSKPRGAPPGTVNLRRYSTVKARPDRREDEEIKGQD